MSKIFVFDTNSLISASLLPNSISRKAFDRALATGLIAVSKETFLEYAEVLYRPKLDKYFHSNNERLSILSRISEKFKNFEPDVSITTCRDPKDNKFLELAITAKASCIITGDDDLLILNPFREIPILNVSKFLKGSSCFSAFSFCFNFQLI